jgi:hypothetical protein
VSREKHRNLERIKIPVTPATREGLDALTSGDGGLRLSMSQVACAALEIGVAQMMRRRRSVTRLARKR